MLVQIMHQVISKAITMCENRGDCFTVTDPTIYNSNITEATTQADSYDSNYCCNVLSMDANL